MLKQLLIVNGAPGIGKTAVCRELLPRLDRCVWLDGDWCWTAHPWIVTEETRAMAERNMIHLLDGFLACSEYRLVLFSWIFRSDALLVRLLGGLRETGYRLRKFTLTCGEEAYRERLLTAGRSESEIETHLATQRACATFEAEPVDTTGRTLEEVAKALRFQIVG